MFVSLGDAALEQFSSTTLAPWTPSWRGSRKFYMVTIQWDDHTQFIAYGSDGMVAFRVQGTMDDLPRFRELMASWRAVEVPASGDIHEALTGGPVSPCGVVIKPPTIPCLPTAQQMLDTELGTSIAAWRK